MSALDVRPAASLEALREDWDRLGPLTANPFASFEWAEAWLRHFGVGRPLALHSVHDASGAVVAILPLYRADRGPVPLLRFLGHGPADELGPVCAPADVATAVAALRQVASQLPPHGLLLADRLPRPLGIGTLVGGRRLREEPTPVLPVAGRTWEEWLQGRSSNMRQQVRRRERKLAREHELRFRRAEDPATLDDDLSLLFALHDARWAEGDSVAFAPPREAFHRDFARRALERGWLRLWFAEVDGTPAAAIYVVRFGGSDWYYQAGRDPRFDDQAVGFVLLTHAIRCAFEDGMNDFRFGLGDEPYKDRFAEEDPGLETVVAGRGPLALLASSAAAAGRRLPAGARRRIVRRAG